jgi:hypothetical protein
MSMSIPKALEASYADRGTVTTSCEEHTFEFEFVFMAWRQMLHQSSIIRASGVTDLDGNDIDIARSEGLPNRDHGLPLE